MNDRERWPGSGTVVTGMILLAATVAAVWLASAPLGTYAIFAAVPLGLSLFLGMERAGTVLLAVGMFCAPLISLQPFTPPPVVTYADLCFVVGFALLLPRLLRQPLKAPALFLVGALLLVCFALVALAIHPEVGQSATGLLRLTYAVIALPLAFRWWNPSLGRITFLVTAYLLGCVYSFVYGLIEGPLADGRHLGLATHPNGFGISLALGLSLVPYLAWRMGDLGWLAYVGALFGAYGVYASGSRAALIVVVLLVFLHLVIERSSGAFVLLVSLGAAVLAAMATQLTSESNALGRLLGAKDAADSDAQRRALLRAGLNQIQEHPLLGGGFEHIRSAHNVYVQVGASLGLIALAGFLMLLLALLMPLRTVPGPRHRLAYPALAFALIGPLTDTLIDTSIWAAVSLAMLALPTSVQPRQSHLATRPATAATRS